LKAREKEIVNAELLLDPLCLNKKEGGDGGWDHINNDPEKKKETQQKRSIGSNSARLEKLKNDEFFRKWFRKWFGKQISNGMKKKYPNGKPATNIYGFSDECNKLSRTPEAIEKRKKTYSEREHQKGEKNSQFGSMWITNGFENRKIKKTDLIPEGWDKGRKC
jgi:hypothetical protein